MFEEQHIRSDQVLEKQDTHNRYIYLVIAGRIDLHKKLKIITHDDKVHDAKPMGISDTISINHGPCVGSIFQSFSLVGEDSALYQEELRYTIVGTKNLICWRVEVSKVLHRWHSYIQKGLREKCIPKYQVILHNVLEMQNNLVRDQKQVN